MFQAVENPSRDQIEKPKAELSTKPEMEQPEAELVENIPINNRKVEPVINHGTEEPDEDKFWPLSGKPYFHMIISKANLEPKYMLFIPSKLNQDLPSADIPVVLDYCGKSWKLGYFGYKTRRRFDSKWKNFAIDNNLKYGDACVFELTECSSTQLKFKVQILRGDFPFEALATAKGQTSTAPIIIDDD